MPQEDNNDISTPHNNMNQVLRPSSPFPPSQELELAAINKSRASHLCKELMLLATQAEQGHSPVETPFGAELWDLDTKHPAFIAASELLRLQAQNERRHYELRRALKIVHPESVRLDLLRGFSGSNKKNPPRKLLFYGDRLGALTAAVKRGFDAISPEGVLVFSTDVALADRIREKVRDFSQNAGSKKSIWRVLLVAVVIGRGFRPSVSLKDFATNSESAKHALQEFVSEGWQTLEFDGPGDKERTYLCQADNEEQPTTERVLPCYLLEYISG